MILHAKKLSSVAVALLFPAFGFAGLSLVLSPTVGGSIVDPNYPQNQSWRVEFQIHNFVLPPASLGVQRFFDLNGLGTAIFMRSDGRLALEDDRDNVDPRQPCFLTVTGYTNALVRVQRDLSTMRFTCEIWNYDGTMYQTNSLSILSTNPWTMSNGSIGGLNVAFGFVRAYTTIIPLGSRPPTTSDRGNWLELKFDGNTNDSSGRGHNATISGATYVNTPNQVAVSVPKSFGAPNWSNWISLRAGYPSKLDGTSSFSLADASSAVTYLWRQTSGPTVVQWSNPMVAQPTVTGLIFGGYTFSLQVTDVAGSTAQTTLQVGAVAYDANGVVIPPNSNVAGLFGPMIAFGQNPWSYEDQQNQYAIHQMVTCDQSYCGGWFNSHYDNSWITLNASGTISYPWAGKGLNPGPGGAKLTAGITASARSISVDHAEDLSLASLPTWILIGSSQINNGQFELLRICNTTATSGPATLTVCYDGRGVSGDINEFSSPGPAQAWNSGTPVGEFKISGSGTKFVTDSAKPVCPAGAPGPPGPVTYSTGAVTLSGGSTTLTGGSGTTFTPAMVGGFVRIDATHDGGTPFTFWSQILSFTDGTHLTLLRPAPSMVDSGLYAFKITAPLYLMLQFPASDGHVVNYLQNIVGCESETAMFANALHDVGAYDGLSVTGMRYSYKNFLWYNSTGTTTPNFYGVGLAGLLYYYRSGDRLGKILSDEINPYITRDPETADGIAPIGNQSLVFGGPVIGTMACLTTGDCPTLQTQNLGSGTNPWVQVEQFALQGEIGAEGCNADDTRDTGYLTAWLTMAANWDADAAKRTAFTAALGPGTGPVMARDQVCRRNVADGYTPAEANSFANAAVWNFGTPHGPVSLTNGSKTMSGTGFTNGSPFPFTGTLTSGSATIAVSNTYGLFPGQAISGTGIQSGSTITSVAPNASVTLNNTATANGSQTLSNNMQPGTCYGMDEGTITVTRNASTATIASVTTNSGTMTPQTGVYTQGNGNSPTLMWFNDGTRDYVYEYTFSGTAMQLSGVYPGYNGTFSFMTTGGGQPNTTAGGLGAIWTDATDDATHNHGLEQSWACRTTSATTANLFKAWPSTSGSSYNYQYYNVQAFGQQPFMLGIKSIQINWAAQSANATIAATYKAMAALVGAWYNANAWDAAISRGSLYDTLATACGASTDRPAGMFGSIHSYEGCAPIGLAGGAASTARTDSVEGGNAMQLLYTGNPTPANKAAVDNFYGAIYGAAQTCAPSIANTCDGRVAGQLATLDSTKWPGFFFGTGGLFSSAWPAARNGTQPASMRTVTVSYSLGSAAAASVIVTAPSSATVSTPCSPTLCSFSVDDRQGSHLYAIQLLSSDGHVISATAPVLLPLPPQP